MSYTKEERERDEREEELASAHNSAEALERIATAAQSCAHYLEQIASDNAGQYSVAYAIRVLEHLDLKERKQAMRSFCPKCSCTRHQGDCQ